MTEQTFESKITDGYIEKLGGKYLEVWNSPTGDVYYNGYVSEILNIGSAIYGVFSAVSKGFLFFDTSPIPDDAVIQSAILRLFCSRTVKNDPHPDFDLVIQTGISPEYPHEPLIPEDFDRTLYTGNGGSINIENIPQEAFIEIALNSEGLSWINKTGVTKLVLRTSREIEGIQPVSGILETVDFFAADWARAVPWEIPMLVVIYISRTGLLEVHAYV